MTHGSEVQTKTRGREGGDEEEEEVVVGGGRACRNLRTLLSYRSQEPEQKCMVLPAR